MIKDNRVERRKVDPVRGTLFSPAERAILLRNGISAQAIYYWEAKGYPGKRMSLRLSELLQRPVLDFLYDRETAQRLRLLEKKCCA